MHYSIFDTHTYNAELGIWEEIASESAKRQKEGATTMDYLIFPNRIRTASEADNIAKSYEHAGRMLEVLKPSFKNANNAIATWVYHGSDSSLASVVAYMEYIKEVFPSEQIINQAMCNRWLEESNRTLFNLNDYVEYLYIKIYELNPKLEIPISELINVITVYRTAGHKGATTMTTKPTINATNLDGNVFAIAGAVQQALRSAGDHAKAARVPELMATSKSYEQALARFADLVEFSFDSNDDDTNDDDYDNDNGIIHHYFGSICQCEECTRD